MAQAVAYIVLCDCDSGDDPSKRREIGYVNDLRATGGGVEMTNYVHPSLGTRISSRQNRRGSNALYSLVCPACTLRIRDLSAATAADVLDGFQTLAIARAKEGGIPIEIRSPNANLADLEHLSGDYVVALLNHGLAASDLLRDSLPPIELGTTQWGGARYVILFKDLCTIVSHLYKGQKRR